jgi:uncharacterized protein (TIGR00369 family)
MKTKSVITHEELQRVLSDEAAFTKIYDFKVQSFADGICTLLVPFQTAFERPGGIVSGTIYMTAADVAMWLAIMTRHGREAMYVSTELNTAFLNAARREDVECTARVLKFGRSFIYGVAECRNTTGKLLTHHTLTYARFDKPSP